MLSFNCLIGVGGYDGDGDITKSANVTAFREYVMDCTDNQGVHFAMADGVSTSEINFRSSFQ